MEIILEAAVGQFGQFGVTAQLSVDLEWNREHDPVPILHQNLVGPFVMGLILRAWSAQ